MLLLPDLPSSDLENFLSCLMSPFSSSSSSGGGFALHRGSISRTCRCLMMANPVPEEGEEEEEEEATREIVIDIEDVSTVGDGDGGNLGEVEEEEEEDDNDSLDGGRGSSSGSPPVTLQRFGPLVCPLCRRRYSHTKARNRHLVLISHF